MFDELINDIKSHFKQEATRQQDVTEAEADRCVECAREAVKEEVQKEAGSGKLGLLANLFSDRDNGNEEEGLLNRIGDSIKTKLMGREGVEEKKATGLKAMIMPMIMKALSGKIGGDSNKIGSFFQLQDVDGDGEKDGLVDNIKHKLGGMFS